MSQPVLDRAHAVSTRHLSAPSAGVTRRHLPRPSEAPAAPVAAPRASASAGQPDPSEPTIDVRTPGYGVRTVEFRPGSETAIVLAASRADVIRLEFSVAVPSVGALARVAALVDESVAEVGRDRAEVRVLLDVEVVLAADERTARRKRSQLEHLDALAGLTWSPAATRVVTTPDRLVDEVRELARRSGVDGVVLLPLSGGEPADAELRALVA
jgi:alkanesulfonate monooxygenase SsuD/methylene tetrahydromethanopterin reductase-like flavin-dependent oxidoreductase (luciferase family)